MQNFLHLQVDTEPSIVQRLAEAARALAMAASAADTREVLVLARYSRGPYLRKQRIRELSSFLFFGDGGAKFSGYVSYFFLIPFPHFLARCAVSLARRERP